MKKVIVHLVIAALMLCSVETVSAFSGSGSGTEEDPFIITDVDELQEMRGTLGAWFKLGNDIDALATQNWNGGSGFVPVGDDPHGFTGHLDGNDFTISGLYINRSSTDCVGLFGMLDRATIKDVRLVDADITGNFYCGTLAGKVSSGSITNCYAAGNLTGNECVGMLAGYAEETSFVECRSAASVSGNYVVGGLIGYNYAGRITDCDSTGTVTARYAWGGYNIGGLVGSHIGDYPDYSSIVNCHSTADVNGSQTVGGLVGQSSDGISIENCYSRGTVTGTNFDIGGLVGYSGWDVDIKHCYSTGDVSGLDSVGGLVGACGYVSISLSYCAGGGTISGRDSVGGLVGLIEYQSNISECYSELNVEGSGNDCGGLVGMNSDNSNILNCYSTGDVYGDSFVGGLLGSNIGGDVANCYSTGFVSAPFNAGGFAGYNSGTCSDNCFWDSETSGQSMSFCGTPKATEEMMQKGTFDPPWDFVSVWGIDEDQAYPYLLAIIARCGDLEHPYPVSDVNHDCHVDFLDFALMALHWLECSAPECD